jgi:hypothetical protein
MPRSIRNFLATHNQLAVSANLQEIAINQEQTLDTTFLVDLNTILNYRPLKYANREEATGLEEADKLYDLGGAVTGSLAFSRAQPQHFAFLMAYALGEVSTVAVGTNGHRHVIRPRSGEVDVARSNPSFTAAMRFGRQVMKRRFASCFVDQVRVEFAKDGWAKVTGVVKGTGKVMDNTKVETVSAAFNAGSLTLAAGGVEGANANDRLANVQAVKVLTPATGAWDEVNYTAVSSGTPAVVTITPPGGSATSTTYKVYYLPRESGWMAFPNRVEEPPLKVSELMVNIGGRWTGTSFTGGYSPSVEIRRILWNFQNNLSPERCPGGGDVASRAYRSGREQKLSFDRDFRDFLLAQSLKDNDCFGMYLKAVGPEFEAGAPYQVEIIFPRVAVSAAPVQVSQRRLSESVEFAVLEDDTYGSVIVQVQNRVSSYAA